MLRKRALRVDGRSRVAGMNRALRMWIVTALVLYCAVFTVVAHGADTASSNSSNSSSSACEVATCTLRNGASCDRTVGGCPICLQFQSTSNSYICTTASKTTNACAANYVTCSTASTSTPSPSPAAPSASPSTTSPSSSADANQASSASDSGVLKPASVETDAPMESGEATTSSNAASSSGFSTWAIIGIGTVVGCVMAGVFGTMYAVRQKRKTASQHATSVSGKDLGGDGNSPARHERGETETTGFTDSVVDYDATPSASNYASVVRSTTSAEGSVFLKSDSWQHTQGSRNTYRGSQSVNMSYIDNPNEPLTTEHLSTSHKTTEYGPDRDSEEDVFATTMNSEWMSSGYYNEGNHSGNTEFYQSKISAIGDDDPDSAFDSRKSERTDSEHVAKWKQKFYVEL